MTFTYNAENQLIQVNNSGGVMANYEYNWQGLRSKKTAGSKVEYYYYTGNELTYITDGSNSLKYFFVRDTTGKLLHMIDYKASPVKVYAYVFDVHGSVVGLAWVQEESSVPLCKKRIASLQSILTSLCIF